jgi:acyl-CoA synthetase (AMP-forming)/AMP-acid ligase II
VTQFLSPAALESVTFVDVLRWRAANHADRLALLFLADGQEQQRLTWGQLDEQAQVVAARLQRLATPSERALLLYPPGLEFIAALFGCFYAGIVAVPAPLPDPINPKRASEALRAVASSARPSLVLSVASGLPLLSAVAGRSDAGRLNAARWLATDALGPELAARWRPPKVGPESLALLQYTSGSTADPKGVMVTHANLLANQRMIQAGWEKRLTLAGIERTEDAVVATWLPLYHDMGLIGNLLRAIWSGALCVLMSPFDFLRRPALWLEMISRYGVRVSGGPNFAYDVCVRKITHEQLAGVDLRSWAVAFNGAEPVRAETLTAFAKAFGPYGFKSEAFFPCYGLAEATLFVAGAAQAKEATVRRMSRRALAAGRATALPDYPVRAGDDRRTDMDLDASHMVSCGQPPPGIRVIVTDPESGIERRSGEVGEVWVTGPSVTLGYWDCFDETTRVFGARLKGSGEGPFLRTGDLGFLVDDELFLTGRLKDLIIIDGRNHYPQDIERTVETCHACVRPGGCAAFSLDFDGRERLVIAAEVAPPQEVPTVMRCDLFGLSHHPRPLVHAVKAAIRQAVPAEHGVPVDAVLVLAPHCLPKTSSGKVKRQACRTAFRASAW